MTYNPKPEVYEKLNSLGYACIQGSQETFNKVPAITFSLGSKSAQYELNKAPSVYEVEMIVDVWANDSVTTSRIASEVEAAMLEIDYLLSYSTDVPAPDGCLHHTNLRFRALKEPNERKE